MRVFLAVLALSAPIVFAAEAPRPQPDFVASSDDATAPSVSASRPAQRPRRPALRAGLDDVAFEYGRPDASAAADSASALRVSAFVAYEPDRRWELRAGLRVDAADQRGGAAAFSQWRGDFGDTYLRYREGDSRITVGVQTVVWGRVDEIPLVDRVSRVDLTRFVIDDLAERRRGQFAVRWEHNVDDYKIDAVLLPAFRGARLSDTRSIWSPIDRLRGEVIGIEPSAALAALVTNASLRSDDGGWGGAALRVTRTGVSPFDFGVTLARTRQTIPYFEADVDRLALTARYPMQNFVGFDVEHVAGGLTWRSELAFSTGQPATRPGGSMLDSTALGWVGAVEFFPGGSDTRVNLQLLARSLRTNDAVLELKEYYGVNGEIESTLGQGRWRIGMRFASGLNVHDIYLAPRLAYVGWEPHEFYATYRYFDGESRTIGGFHRDHGMFAVGVKTRF